jgi:hypothetical protein
MPEARLLVCADILLVIHDRRHSCHYGEVDEVVSRGR